MTLAAAPLLDTRTNCDADRSLHEVLADLFREQLHFDPGNTYLRNHSQARQIDNHVRTFHWYRPFLPEMGRVLDWGCQHAPDSCLLRAWYGQTLELSSCDFPESRRHRVFHEFARTVHDCLEDSVLLPYRKEQFDAVIGSGVLEHAARDGACLDELYRVIKPGGVLIITYLPNRLSIQEWLRRVIRKRDFHRRLYGRAEACHLLKHHGFYPLAVRYHTFFWERSGLPGAGWLARLLPVQIFCSALCIVARRMRCM
jgi:SAM-dependent methyltransferase